MFPFLKFTIAFCDYVSMCLFTQNRKGSLKKKKNGAPLYVSDLSISTPSGAPFLSLFLDDCMCT